MTSPFLRAVVLFGTICLLVPSIGNATDLDAILKKATEAFDKQMAIRFESGEAFKISIKLEQNGEVESITHLSVLEGKGGLDVSQRWTSDRTAWHVYLSNDDYGATLSRTKFHERLTLYPRKPPEALHLQKLGSGYKLENSWQPNEAWFQSMIRNNLTARYFSFGNVEFSKGVTEWRQGAGTVQLLEAGPERKLHELTFSKWGAGDEGKMIYRIDPVHFVIQEIEAVFSGIESKLKVEKFTEIQGMLYPQKVLLENESKAQDIKLRKGSEWQAVDRASIGFRKEQLYAPYYGQPNPKMN